MTTIDAPAPRAPARTPSPPGPTMSSSSDSPRRSAPWLPRTPGSTTATPPSSAEAYDVMRENGYLALSVPTELGGLGATLRQVCYAQAELARHDGATALAAAMHQYLTALQAFRHRSGAPDAEGVLRRVADEEPGHRHQRRIRLAVAHHHRVADDGDGNLRVNGRKTFCSQSPEASVIATSAVLGEPGEGAEVLHFSVPLGAEGVRIDETWDTLGMRGTASHDVVLEDVVVPTDKVAGRRPYGEFGGP